MRRKGRTGCKTDVQKETCMPCTTILVGKKGSHDGSTIITHKDGGAFEAWRLLAHSSLIMDERHQNAVLNRAQEFLYEYDEKIRYHRGDN